MSESTSEGDGQMASLIPCLLQMLDPATVTNDHLRMLEEDPNQYVPLLLQHIVENLPESRRVPLSHGPPEALQTAAATDPSGSIPPTGVDLDGINTATRSLERLAVSAPAGSGSALPAATTFVSRTTGSYLAAALRQPTIHLSLPSLSHLTGTQPALLPPTPYVAPAPLSAPPMPHACQAGPSVLNASAWAAGQALHMSDRELDTFRKSLKQPGDFDHATSTIPVQDWLSAWKTYFITALWSPHIWAPMAATFLRGLSADQWNAYVSSKSVHPSWDDFCSFMLNVSGQRLTPEIARDNLSKLQQTGKIADFLSSWRKEYQRITPDLRPDTYTAIHIILANALTPVLCRRLFPKQGGGHYDDLDAFLNLVMIEGQELEIAQERQRTKNNRNSGSTGHSLGVNATTLKVQGARHHRASGFGHHAARNGSSGPKGHISGNGQGSVRGTHSGLTHKNITWVKPFKLTDAQYDHLRKEHRCFKCAGTGHDRTSSTCPIRMHKGATAVRISNKTLADYFVSKGIN
jgi:hypothetical protein